MGFGEHGVVVDSPQEAFAKPGVGDAGDRHGLVAHGQSPQIGHAVFGHDHHAVVGRGGQADARRVAFDDLGFPLVGDALDGDDRRALSPDRESPG